MRRSVAVGLAMAAGVVGMGPLSAQEPGAISSACLVAGGDGDACAASALAAQALVGHLGLAVGGGSEVSGTASNLGQRLGTTPRVVLTVRYGWVGAGLPDLTDPAALAERAPLVATADLDVAVGLFDGFRLAPTVGGFLAVDLFGRAGFVLLPSDDAFDGRVSAYTIGARIGVFRESFTLPGVSVSASRRTIGEAGYGDATTGAGAITVDPSVTSLRATVGKNLFGFELLAGLGLDDHGADVGWTVADGVGGTVTGTGSLDRTRRVYFGSAARTFSIVLTISLEVGWSEGFDPVAGYAGAFDPSAASFFGGAAFRLTI